MSYIDIIKRREKQSAWRINKTKKQREDIFSILGEVCCICGFNDKRALAIDHINGGGTKERKIGGGYYSLILNKLKNNSKDYQILCFNCNQIKKVENKE